MDLVTATDLINKGGVLVIIVIITLAGLKRIWVWGWVYRDQLDQEAQHHAERTEALNKQLAEKDALIAKQDIEIQRIRDVFENKVLPALQNYTEVTQDLLFRERQKRGEEF